MRTNLSDYLGLLVCWSATHTQKEFTMQMVYTDWISWDFDIAKVFVTVALQIFSIGYLDLIWQMLVIFVNNAK